MKLRKEFDSIGKISVPNDKYWGASTQRSKKYFDIGEFLVRPILIKSIAIIKKAAATVHGKEKQILTKISKAIVKASNEVISGKLDEHFPLKVWQTGSGTQTNMNVNEVIANRAIEILGGKKGSKKPVHPNDHVNKSQSTNDVFPTAMHIAIAIETKNKLLPALELLNKELKRKVSQFKKIVKVGRTHLQDATPLSLGQEFSGYQSQLEDCISRIKNALNEIYLLAQGGTAVGTGINTHPKFSNIFCKYLKKETSIKFTSAKHKFIKIANIDQFVKLSSILKSLACKLIKICNDLRLMNSGPISGFSEIELPKVQPGSSIMPGKVNPVICESMLQICAKIIGIDSTVTIASQSGNFQLNVMYPLIANELLFAIMIMSNGLKMLVDSSLNGLKINKLHVEQILSINPILVTALNPIIGYELAAEIAKKSYETGTPIIDLAENETNIPRKKLKQILDPYLLTKGGL